MTPVHLAFMVLICLVWGFNFVAAKTGLQELPPLLFTALRFLLVALLIAPFLRRFPAPRMRQIVLIAVLGGSLHFGLIFLGLTITDASIAAIVAQLNVPFATLLSIWWLGEHVGWRRWTGIGAAFGGVALIGVDPHVIPDLRGVGLVALGGLSIATAMILMRRLSGVRPLQLQAWIALLSWPPLLLFSLGVEAHQWAVLMEARPLTWAALAYTAVGASIVGHAGFYYLLQRYEVSLAGPLTLMAPIFGMFFGITLLGEPFSWRIGAGAALTLLGVLLVAMRSRAAPEAAPGALTPAAKAAAAGQGGRASRLES